MTIMVPSNRSQWIIRRPWRWGREKGSIPCLRFDSSWEEYVADSVHEALLTHFCVVLAELGDGGEGVPVRGEGFCEPASQQSNSKQHTVGGIRAGATTASQRWNSVGLQPGQGLACAIVNA